MVYLIELRYNNPDKYKTARIKRFTISSGESIQSFCWTTATVMGPLSPFSQRPPLPMLIAYCVIISSMPSYIGLVVVLSQ